MTKLTIKIDENISLTGTIMSEDDAGVEEFWYYQPGCPFDANCDYSGNIVTPLAGNAITGNTVPITVPPGWRRPRPVTGQGWYEMPRNLFLTGNLAVSGESMFDGNIYVAKSIHGIGSLANVLLLENPLESPTMPGVPGQVSLHQEHLYVCIMPNTWIRLAVMTNW